MLKDAKNVSKKEAKRLIWSALHTTLQNDIDGVGAGYIFDYSQKVAAKLENAAREILEQLAKKAGV